MTMGQPARAWALPGRTPAIVLGRGQRHVPVLPLLPVRQRASGGGAVLTGPWLLRAAIRLPREHALLRQGPAPVARWFGGVLLQWLHDQGLPQAQLYAGPALEHWACFGGRGPGELLVQGRKLAGIAQAWRRHAVLVSAGTLLYTPPWSVLCDALGQPASAAAELAAGTVSLQDCLGRNRRAPALARSLENALRGALARPVAPQENGAAVPSLSLSLSLSRRLP